LAKKKKKDKRRPRKPRSDLEAKMPRPRPVTMHGPRYYIERAREYPILGSWIMKGWQESGITPVVIAREQSPDEVIFASYLVDFYCLGVKDALCNANFPLKRFKNNLPDLCSGKPEACDIGLAHEMVYGAIDFARRYGFEPHPDFELASMVLDPPGIHPFKHDLEFGKDGKPLFVAGPYDDAEAIVKKLTRTAGEGNFNYMAMLGDIGDFEDLEDFEDLQ
jgi:hypothetical protein